MRNIEQTVVNGLHVETLAPPNPAASILFLHGGLGLDHTYFRPFVDPLSEDFRLVFVDHRSNGRSARSEAGLTLDLMVGDTVAVVREACRGRAFLAGHSFGAHIALGVCQAHPEVVDGLLLIASGLSETSGHTLLAHAKTLGTPAQHEVIARAFEGAMTSDEEYRQAWDTILPLYFRHYSPELAHAMFERVHFSLEGFYQFIPVLGSLDWRAGLARLRAPLLLIGGRDDFLEKDAFGSTAAMAALSPQASSVVMDAGHFPFVEQPNEFCDRVRSWIRGL